MASLQEQLLKAGIADEKKAKKIKQEQRKAKKANKGKPQVDEGKLAAQRALAEKAERPRDKSPAPSRSGEKGNLCADFAISRHQ